MKVKIYTTTTCPFCRMEKDYLTSKNIDFENVYVDEEPKAAEELMELSGQLGVPFTVVTVGDGSKESILGFDKERLNKVLNIS